MSENKHEHISENETMDTHLPGKNIHAHTHSNTKQILNRLSRIIGHLESVKKMVESERDCSEVLIQISAVSSALNGVKKVMIKDHIEHCIVDAVKESDLETIEKLVKAIDKFM